MNKRCKHVKQDGFNCGSYAFNLYMDDIDQGDLCDVHYWQAKAQRTWIGLTKEDKDLIEDLCEMMIGDAAFSTIEAILKGNNGFAEEKNT